MRALDETFAFDDVDVGQCGATGSGMTRVGEAGAQEEVGVGLEWTAHSGADEHAAERLVSRRDGLGERDEVGAHAETMGGEPMTESAEAADHLVEDQEGTVLIAQSAHALDVSLGGWEHATRTLYGFDQDGGETILVLRHRDGQRLEVVGGYLHHVAHQRAVSLAIGRNALRARSAVGGAVVAALTRDDDGLLGMTRLDVSEARQLHGGVDGFRTR